MYFKDATKGQDKKKKSIKNLDSLN